MGVFNSSEAARQQQIDASRNGGFGDSLDFLDGLRRGGSSQGGFGGAVGGASTGFAIGGPTGAAIGAGVGLVSNFVSSLFARGRKKKQRGILDRFGEGLEDFRSKFAFDKGQVRGDTNLLRESLVGDVKELRDFAIGRIAGGADSPFLTRFITNRTAPLIARGQLALTQGARQREAEAEALAQQLGLRLAETRTEFV